MTTNKLKLLKRFSLKIQAVKAVTDQKPVTTSENLGSQQIG